MVSGEHTAWLTADDWQTAIHAATVQSQCESSPTPRASLWREARELWAKVSPEFVDRHRKWDEEDLVDEGPAWERADALVWQVLDAGGRPLTDDEKQLLTDGNGYRYDQFERLEAGLYPMEHPRRLLPGGEDAEWTDDELARLRDDLPLLGPSVRLNGSSP